MKLNGTNLLIQKNRTTGEIYCNAFDGSWRPGNTTEEKNAAAILYRTIMKKSSVQLKLQYCEKICQLYNAVSYGQRFFKKEETTTEQTSEQITEQKTEEKIDFTEQIKTSIEKLINFFSEFDFEPNFRFVNTFARICYKNKNLAKDYIKNYFALTDNPYASSISEKMKSAEFTDICQNISVQEPTKCINNRFKLYYGSQGTGKTTEALKETEGRCMVCHSAMLPNDLMEDFKFVDGKAEFTPSALQIAMTNGYSITLDEINLLPFESLRFLQSILDGKKEIIYKGKTIEIKDGFKIIGTMNLTVNGSTYSLPEPLVDRCEDIKKYQLTAENLVSAII